MNNAKGIRGELNEQNERGVRVAECSFVFQAWALASSLDDIKLMSLHTCGASVSFWPKKIIKAGRNYWPNVEVDLIVECYELVATDSAPRTGVFVCSCRMMNLSRELGRGSGSTKNQRLEIFWFNPA